MSVLGCSVKIIIDTTYQLCIYRILLCFLTFQTYQFLITQQFLIKVLTKIMGSQNSQHSPTKFSNQYIIQNMSQTNFHQAISHYKKHFNENTVDSAEEKAIIYNNLAVSYNSKGEFELAIQNYNKCLEFYLDNYGSQNVSVAIIYNNVASIFFNQKTYRQALHFYRKSIKIFLALPQRNYVMMANVYNNMGLCFLNRRQYQAALDHLVLSLQIKLDKKIGNIESIATTYYNIGNVYYEKQSYELAIQNYQKILTIDPKNQSSFILLVLNNLANAYDQIHNTQKALQYYEEALELDCKLYPANNLLTASTFENIGFTYQKTGQYSKAYEAFYRAYIIRCTILGRNDQLAQHSLDDMQRCKQM